MAKQLNVNLSFDANVDSAKKKIKDLQDQLASLQQGLSRKPNMGLTSELAKANKDIASLQAALNTAMNKSTGRLDLSAFNTSMKQAGLSVEQLSQSLSMLGPAGSQAFVSLTKQIATASAQINKSKSLLGELATTLKNTAKWQISSSLIHGFMGSVQSAYGYAQDLNESLNKIRIVTGQNTDQMAKFAEQANKSAKALSTTTTAYTDAALIFYQQGLGDADVQKRTDAVIKMANVTGDSATEVSSYMTAIWNNYAKGSDNLEHFADVITALGASTASSSSEIAEGLEKFAAIGDTIGLSYDYATSILAALVANTRQSADVIGTSLKTIFARLQGLSLGETLEDGVTLNKYSKALKTVGVDILDTTGKMKDANLILDETAAKWENLSKAQQTALAQTVAGTRQYAQFVAMMEGWDDVQTNLGTAADADGTLQEQQDIYAESWEAARDRVKAAAEGIYNDLLDDDFFIKLSNGFAVVLDGINNTIDALGGLKGVLPVIGTLILRIFGQEIQTSMNMAVASIKNLTGQAKAEARANSQAYIDQARNTLAQSRTSTEFDVASFEQQLTLTNAIVDKRQELNKLGKDFNATQQATIDNLNVQIDKMAEQLALSQQQVKNARFDLSIATRNATTEATDEIFGKGSVKRKETATENISSYVKNKKKMGIVDAAYGVLSDYTDGSGGSSEAIGDARERINLLIDGYKKAGQEIPASVKAIAKSLNDTGASGETLDKAIKRLESSTNRYEKGNKELIKSLQEVGISEETIEEITANLDSKVNSYNAALRQEVESYGNLTNVINATKESIDSIQAKFTAADVFMRSSQALMNFGMALSNISGIVDTLNNPDLSGWEKFTSILTSLSMTSMMTISTFNQLSPLLHTINTLVKATAVQTSLLAAAEAIESKEKQEQALKTGALVAGKILEDKENKELITSEILLAKVRAAMKDASEEEIAVAYQAASAKLVEKGASDGLTFSLKEQAAAAWASLGPYAAIAGAILAVVAAMGALAIINKRVSASYDFENARKAVKATSDVLEETTTKANNLKSAFDSYDSVVEKLKSCTKGTQEWKDALNEVNTQVLDLMDQYPELADKEKGYIQKNSDGYYEVDTNAITKEVDATVANAKAANVIAKQNSRNSGDIVDISNQIGKEKSDERLARNIAGLTALTAASGGALLPAAAGAGVAWMGTKAVDSYFDNKNATKFAESIQQAIETGIINSAMSEEDLKSTLAAQGIDIPIEDGLSDAVKALEDNTNATKIENETLAKSFLKDNEKVQNSKYSNQVADTLADGLSDKINAERDRILKEEEGWNGAGLSMKDGVNKVATTMFDKYADAVGLSGAQLVDTKGLNGSTFVYELDGIQKEISKEAMAAAVASATINGQLNDAAEKLSEVFVNIAKNNNAKDDALIDFAADRNFENASQEQMDYISKMTDDQLIALFGSEEQLVEALGENYRELIDTQYKLASESLKTAGEELISNRIESMFTNLKFGDDVTIAGKRAVAQMLEDAFEGSGKEAAQNVSDILAKTGTKADEFAKALSGVDWKTTSVTALKRTLDQASISVNLTDKEWQDLIAAMQASEGILDNVTEKYKKLHDVINDLAAGDTISKEDYEALGGEIYESFFLKMADGTYKLTTDAQSFYDIVNQESIKGFEHNIALINSVKSSGYDADTISDNNYTKTGILGIGDIKIDEKLLGSQIDFLDAIGYHSEDYANWKLEVQEGGEISEEALKGISGLVNENIGEWERFDDIQRESREQLASTATNLKELHAMLESGKIETEQFTKAAMAMDAAEDLEGVDSKELKNYADYLQEASKNMEGFNDEMSAMEARTVAKGILKMNSAIETLANNFVKSEKDADSWIDILKKSQDTSEEYAEAMLGTREAVADLLDISKDYVSSDFIKAHLDEINKAATGNAKAIDSLREALAKDFVANIKLENGDKAKAELQSFIDEYKSAFDELKVGKSLDSTEFLNSLNEMIKSTGMTVDQINALFDTMGFEANFAEAEQPVQSMIPGGYKITPSVELKNEDGQLAPSITAEVEPLDPVPSPAGYVSAFAMTTDGSAPKIKSVTKQASGSSNNWSSSNKGGKSSPKKSSGKSKDKKDRIEERPDAYHDINRSIAQVSDAMEKLDKQQSHLYGKELISSLQYQNELIQQQVANYKELGKVIESEKSRLQGTLAGYGVTFDNQTGEILNYTEAYIAAVNAYNEAIDKYNTSAQSDTDKKALENAKKAYDKFKSLMSEYDSTLDKQMQNEQDKLEALYNQIENNFKAWETEIQITLDLSSAKQEWKKFWQKVNKDIKSAYKDYAKELGNLTENFDLRKNDITTDIKAIQDIQNDMDSGNIGKEGSRFAFISEAQNALLEYSNTLREDAEDLYDIYQDAWDEYLDGIDQVIDKWDDLLDRFDDINDSLDHYAKVIELLYKDGDMAKQLNAEIYNATNQNNLGKMGMLREQIAALQKEREEIIAAGAKETDEDVKRLTEAIENGQKEMESAIEDYLSGLADQFQNSVTMAMREMEKAITNGSSYNTVSQHWEDAQYAAEGYYDEIERIYKLESMENKWQSAINSTTGLKNQQKLKDLMDAQLKNLESKTKLSEYDIELAEKQLAVAQAQIALEEAQNNKNSMKLVRNEEGNWAYQYVADEGDVADKQQALLDANNDWYEFTKQSWQDLTQTIWEDIQSAQERITTLMEEYNTADAARREEIQAELDYLNEYYFGEEGLIATKIGETVDYVDNLNLASMNSLWDLYTVDEENFDQMTQNEKELIEQLRDDAINSYELLLEAVAGDGEIYDQMAQKCEEINAQSLEAWNTTAAEVIRTWNGDSDSVRGQLEIAYEAVEAAQSYYDQMVEDGCEAAGYNFANVSEAIDDVSQRTAVATDAVVDFKDETARVSDLRSTVISLGDAWGQVAAKIAEATRALEDYLTRNGSTFNRTNSTYNTNAVASLNASVTNAYSGAQSAGGRVSATKNTASATSWYHLNISKDPYSNSTMKYTTTESGMSGYSIREYPIKKGTYSVYDASGRLIGYTTSKNWISGFDTGGYTGQWGDSSGKLAMLHEKELVLNKTDTQNILQAVDSVRQMGNIGSAITAAISNGVAATVKSLLGLDPRQAVKGLSSAPEQNNQQNTFNISAEFPNAENVNDIREAILSLPTLASQYLSQRKL